jgi:hypothetical protein
MDTLASQDIKQFMLKPWRKHILVNNVEAKVLKIYERELRKKAGHKGENPKNAF